MHGCFCSLCSGMCLVWIENPDNKLMQCCMRFILVTLMLLVYNISCPTKVCKLAVESHNGKLP